MSGLILPAHMQEHRRKQQVARQIASRIASEVAKVYPGHMFQFEVQPDQGTVFIDHHLLSSNKVRYVVHTADGIGKVLQYCGEILERLNLPRQGLVHFDQYDEVEANAKEAFASR